TRRCAGPSATSAGKGGGRSCPVRPGWPVTGSWGWRSAGRFAAGEEGGGGRDGGRPGGVAEQVRDADRPAAGGLVEHAPAFRAGHDLDGRVGEQCRREQARLLAPRPFPGPQRLLVLDHLPAVCSGGAARAVDPGGLEEEAEAGRGEGGEAVLDGGARGRVDAGEDVGGRRLGGEG